MELDNTLLLIVGGLVAALIVDLRMFRRELRILIPAAVERSRRRDMRQRRESAAPPIRRTPRSMEAVPGPFEGEDTDIHVLMNQEREKQRRPRHPGERAPRPGTRSDKPYEED